MPQLARLRVDRFRNARPGIDLKFGPTFNVLLGKNATGKSTLLDLIAAATNDDLSPYSEEEGGYDITYWLAKDDREVEVHAARKRAMLGQEAAERGNEKVYDDTSTIVLRTANVETDRFEVSGATGNWLQADGSKRTFELRLGTSGRRVALRALFAVADFGDVHATAGARRIRDALDIIGFWGEVPRFDEALGTFSAIGQAQFQLGREGSGGGHGSFGAWLPIEFVRVANEPATGEALVVPFTKLGQLATIPQLLGFTSAELRPRLLARSQDGEKVTSKYLGFDCLFARADGSKVSYGLLSFGQKRLFAFLWYLAVRQDRPVVADELLNGLHHEWIRACFDRMEGRQSFLATQHPLLLDHIPVTSIEAAETTFIRCSSVVSSNGGEQLDWRNFDHEEAERFFIAYQTGIQQVSEVLRSEGLW